MTQQDQQQDMNRRGLPKTAVLLALGLLGVSVFMFASIAYRISLYGFGAAG